HIFFTSTTPFVRLIMKSVLPLLAVAILVMLNILSTAAYTFQVPAAGKFYGGSQECVPLVFQQCGGVRYTDMWGRGSQVFNNRNMAYGTAIATFAGPGNSYENGGSGKQHAAIFLRHASNTADGFWVSS